MVGLLSTSITYSVKAETSKGVLLFKRRAGHIQRLQVSELSISGSTTNNKGFLVVARFQAKQNKIQKKVKLTS